MAKIYWRTIKRGTRTFKDVPEELKEAVKEVAKQEVANGELTANEYFTYIGEQY